jgi:cardiolipin synthase
MLAASAFVPLWNRAAEWERRLTMIREARTFLYLSTFYIEYDAYAIALLAALGDAQRRGVAVNLLIDKFGQRLGGILMSRSQLDALARAFDALRAAGAVVTLYEPPHLVQRLVGAGHHVKIQVSDAGEAIFASGNITKTSFEGWNEYAVTVRGAVVRTLLESYRLIGGTVADAHLAHLSDVASDAPGDIALEYWFCNPVPMQGVFGPFGWRGPNAVTDRMVEMLDAAVASARLTSFYFKPVPVLMDAVLRAARRGVRVEVFHSHRDALPTTDLAWIAAAVNYDRLLDAGVVIYENRHGEHSKIVLIDDQWMACGSYNFEDAAHDRLAEAMLSSRDRRAVEPAIAILDALRDDPDNVRVTRESFRDLPARVRTRIARYGRFKRWM